MIRIAIVVGSTRPGRRGEAVARWIHGIATGRGDATYELVDLADHDLPHLDEPVPAAKSAEYVHAHTRAWSSAIASFDGYVFVTPEYNHSTTGVLKNAIDHLFVEWNDKAAGFVGYGLTGGTRAVEHLRLIMGELQVADVRAQVALSMSDFQDGDLRPGPQQSRIAHVMLDQVVSWAGALRTVRVA
jgi:Predicted flavoprotein